MANLFDNSIRGWIAAGGNPDDPRTPAVREVYHLDAITKRHYTKTTIYEWDERKRLANLEKHGLDFFNANLLYESEFKVTTRSEKGGPEIRFIDYGELDNVLVALIYTIRNDAVRLISFRPAKRTERSVYHAAFKNR